jgi:hypothetical protein
MISVLQTLKAQLSELGHYLLLVRKRTRIRNGRGKRETTASEGNRKMKHTHLISICYVMFCYYTLEDKGAHPAGSDQIHVVIKKRF